MGIEPTYEAWEASILPLNYTRGGAKQNTAPFRRGNLRFPALGARSLTWHDVAKVFCSPSLSPLPSYICQNIPNTKLITNNYQPSLLPLGVF